MQIEYPVQQGCWEGCGGASRDHMIEWSPESSQPSVMSRTLEQSAFTQKWDDSKF